MKRLLLILNTLIMSGCSLFGDNGVEDAPYSVVDSAANGVMSMSKSKWGQVLHFAY